MLDLTALVLSCAPLVAQDTAHALIRVESAGNPYAIGVVGGALQRQPVNLAEALAATAALDAAGWNYSVGLGQINKRNFPRFGLSTADAFGACANLGAMQGILGECYQRASRHRAPQAALRDALSCYYSGNFVTGHRHGYVNKVLAAWSARAPPVLPAPRSPAANEFPPTRQLHRPSFPPAVNPVANPGATP
jgi:type IV secretion system protein VirB1